MRRLMGRRWLGVGAVLLACALGCDDGATAAPDGAVDLAVVDAAVDAAVDAGTPAPPGQLRAGDARVTLWPAVRVDGQWLGGDGAECTVEPPDTVTCPAGEGRVRATWGEGRVRITADLPAPTIEALALVGQADLPGATGWISSGLQSWSQAGVLALGTPVDDARLAQALAATGDAEVIRRGSELSWWFTAVGGGPQTFAAAAVDLDVWPAWATVGRDGDRVVIRLVTGMTGEPLPPGEVAATWWVGLGDSEATLAALGDALPSRRWTHPVPAEAGWNSWYELWDGVDEAAVRANAAFARTALADRLPPAAPPLRITVDDGWQRAWGDWQPNDKFPNGLDGLAADLRADGFTLGVWLAPLLV